MKAPYFRCDTCNSVLTTKKMNIVKCAATQHNAMSVEELRYKVTHVMLCNDCKEDKEDMKDKLTELVEEHKSQLIKTWSAFADETIQETLKDYVDRKTKGRK